MSGKDDNGKKVPTIKLTDLEHSIIDKAAELWNMICKLPVEHDDDGKEYCRDIHNIQYRVAARPTRRMINNK